MNRSLRIMVAEDEPLARKRVLDLLASSSADFTVVSTPSNGRRAVTELRRCRDEGAPVDVLFLDVEMPGLSGLGVLDAFDADMLPVTVFVTAYDQHAIAAFDAAAVDYLLKPYDDERFAEALARASRAVAAREAETDGAPDAEPHEHPQRFVVESRGRTRFVQAETVDYIAASGPYAELHAGDEVHLIRETMQALEDVLDPASFVRIHRSTIVQVDRIESILSAPGGRYSVQLRSGENLPVSRKRRDLVVERLGMGTP